MQLCPYLVSFAEYGETVGQKSPMSTTQLYLAPALGVNPLEFH